MRTDFLNGGFLSAKYFSRAIFEQAPIIESMTNQNECNNLDRFHLKMNKMSKDFLNGGFLSA